MIEKALVKAKELHKNQYRKGSEVPYFVHIIDVYKNLLYELDLSEEAIIAGILHDTLEDTNYTKEDIINDFGPKVYSIVNFCSEPGNTPNSSIDEDKKSWKSRKLHSIENLKNGTQEQIIVFIADKYSNLMSMREDLILNGDNLWNKFNAPKEEIGWYYKSLRDEANNLIPNRRIFKLYNNLVNEVFI